jgi:thiol-disulfide isomerase/thioredoxin
MLIMVMASWCGHCKSTKPAFEQAAQQIHDRNIGTCAYICSDGKYNEGMKPVESMIMLAKRFCDKHDIQGYPTILRLNTDNTVKMYQGPRKPEEFIEFISAN